MNGDAIDAPLEVHLHRGGDILELRWADGTRSVVSAGVLRRACACAYCEAARRRDQAPTGAGIALTRVALAGPGALQLFFSDGHDRGRFPWGFLFDLAERGPAMAGADA